jgi:chitodextrinase
MTALNQANADIRYLNRIVATQNERITSLEDQLTVEKANAGAYEAWVRAFIAQHPDSPLRADSGKRFKATGNVKTKGRLVYEAAFDTTLREMGIANPVSRRAN